MVGNAFEYEQEVQQLFLKTWYDLKYQYYHSYEGRCLYIQPKDGDWNSRHFVSLNSKGEVIGFIGYEVIRDANIACNFGAINFTDDIITFGLDLAQIIDDIFMKFNMNKLEFNVVCGNPIEKSYDKIIKRIGGKILCKRKDRAKLIDGTIHDDKLYEIMREYYVTTTKGSKRYGK